MSTRSQLFNEAKALGLNPVWKTSTVSSLDALLRPHRIAVHEAAQAERVRREALAREIRPSPDSSFEEQFDSIWPEDVFYQDALARLDQARVRRLSDRIRAGIDLVRLRAIAENRENIRSASIELVGEDYVVTHPESAVDAVERLRRVKREVLMFSATRRYDDPRKRLLNYICNWEAALTPEQVQLYL